MSEELYRQEMIDELIIMFSWMLTTLIVEDGIDVERVIVLLIEAVIHSRLDHPLPEKDAEQLDYIVRALKEMIEETVAETVETSSD